MHEIPVVFTTKQKAYNVHRAELYSWEIHGFDESFVIIDRKKHQQGEEVEKYFCLVWDEDGQEGDEGKGNRLPDNFYEAVLELCNDVYDNKRFHKLEDFWSKWGPLVSTGELNFKGSRTLPIPTIQNILSFFRQITVLWDSCLYENPLPIQELFKNYTWLYGLENFFSVSNRVDSLYLYFERERPHISGNKAYIFGTEFYIELKDMSIKDGRPAITTDSAEIIKYMRRTLIHNINRLTKAWSSSINFERDRFKATTTPNSLFSAALFSYVFTRSRQIRYCLSAGCGNFARPGSRYCSDSCQQKTHNESRSGTVAGMRDKALTQYRIWKNRRKISSDNYEKIKQFAHTVSFGSTEELKKQVEAYRIQEGIYPKKPT